MAAIYQEVELHWRGQAYKVTPTYAMIQQIEQKVSISSTALRLANGDTPVSHVAEIAAHLLYSAGAKDASPDAVYAEMMTDMAPEQVGSFASVIISGFVPQRSAPGNGEAPAKGAPSTGGGRQKTKQ